MTTLVKPVETEQGDTETRGTTERIVRKVEGVKKIEDYDYSKLSHYEEK